MYRSSIWTRITSTKEAEVRSTIFYLGKLMIFASLGSISFLTMVRWLKELKELRIGKSRASSLTFRLCRAPSHLLSSLLFLDILLALLTLWENSVSPLIGTSFWKGILLNGSCMIIILGSTVRCLFSFFYLPTLLD